MENKNVQEMVKKIMDTTYEKKFKAGDNAKTAQEKPNVRLTNKEVATPKEKSGGGCCGGSKK